MHDDWEPTKSLSPLDADSLELWRIDLDHVPGPIDYYLKTLSPEELERAARLRAGHVKAQFVIARACLRLLLGFNLSLGPRDVPIELSSYGKPKTPPVNGRDLFFNLAHSRSTIVIALSRMGSVGVDLEYLDRNTDIMEVASNLFSPEESEQFATIADEHQRRLAFFRCWTRKEAVAKADGRGSLAAFYILPGPAHRNGKSFAGLHRGWERRDLFRKRPFVGRDGSRGFCRCIDPVPDQDVSLPGLSTANGSSSDRFWQEPVS